MGAFGIKNGDYAITLAIRLVLGMFTRWLSITIYGVDVDIPFSLVISFMRYFIE